MAIPIYERQAGIAPIPDAKVRNAGGPEAYGAGVWRAAEGFANAFQAKAEEFEDASTLEAFNNFKREVMDYHSNPDKGIYNTKLGKDAVGAAEQADLYVDNLTAKYAGGMKSGRAAQNFYRMAGQLRDRYAQANMDFESKQVEAYKNAEAKATIELGLNDIAANYADDAAVESVQAQMMQALELQTRGLGDEARKLALQEMQNSIATTRVARMLDEDPDTARAWYAENRDQFNAETQAKVDAQIEIYENQEISMGLVQEFGKDKRAAVAYILDNYEGKRQNKILHDYYLRHARYMRERNLSVALEGEKREKTQRGNYERAISTYTKGGGLSDDEIEAGRKDGTFSGWQADRLTDWNDALDRYGEATERLAETVPGWSRMSEVEQDALRLREVGTTPERRASALERLESGFGKEATGELARRCRIEGVITREDERRLCAEIEKFEKLSEPGPLFASAGVADVGQGMPPAAAKSKDASENERKSARYTSEDIETMQHFAKDRLYASDSKRKTFLEEIVPGALAASNESGVLPSVILAQAILESGWGRKAIGNNLFGIKAGRNWKGRVQEVWTHEERNGKKVKIKALFRDYDSVAESIADHGKLMKGTRYASVRKARNYEDALKGLQGVYASDAEYAKKLSDTIKAQKLYVLDIDPAMAATIMAMEKEYEKRHREKSGSVFFTPRKLPVLPLSGL